jgi:hypothetical protein
MLASRTIPLAVLWTSICVYSLAQAEDAIDGWQPVAPRDEIRPAFSYENSGGPHDASRLVITQDDRKGLDGYWQKTFPIQGGDYWKFSCRRRTALMWAINTSTSNGLVM